MPIARNSWTVRDKLDRQDSATRARLLTAARTVFERRGYARTTIADITAEADVGRATFYVYFASKQDVFAVLAADLRDRFLAAQEATGPDAEDPYLLAEHTNAAFLDAYVDNLAFLTVLEHQSLTDPAMRGLRDEIRDRPRGRTARYIARLVRQGLAEPAGSPESVAAAAGGMVASFAQTVAADPTTRDRAVAELTAMYLRLLGLTPRAGQRPPQDV
ncbi:TetR/AcrR family transcriptional regulator [Streptomyces sp. NPDC058067]|uniref:TetR/AcrR family transcriptional regulator n=1 Tax=Streptomyces antnestii TaxID=2494256 RepID=A0A3S2VG70_9ACTN|nr:TetR/AcrR family transcriptional regulator [Streptomyces sp. San01]RVU22313.1 TetR/AcrR family transcriptional regulator [Streptomyces sp. San01]